MDNETESRDYAAEAREKREQARKASGSVETSGDAAGYATMGCLDALLALVEVVREPRHLDEHLDERLDNLAEAIWRAAFEEKCAQCGHPQSWHRHDDAKETEAFRCVGYDCMAPGKPRPPCGCPDYVPPDPEGATVPQGESDLAVGTDFVCDACDHLASEHPVQLPDGPQWTGDPVCPQPVAFVTPDSDAPAPGKLSVAELREQEDALNDQTTEPSACPCQYCTARDPWRCAENARGGRVVACRCQCHRNRVEELATDAPEEASPDGLCHASVPGPPGSGDMSECQLPDGHEGECDPNAGLDRADDPFANSRRFGVLREPGPDAPYVLDEAKEIVLDAEASKGAGEDRLKVIRRTEKRIQALIRQHSTGGIDAETRERAGELASTILRLLDIRVGKYIKLTKTEADAVVCILRTVASAPEARGEPRLREALAKELGMSPDTALHGGVSAVIESIKKRWMEAEGVGRRYEREDRSEAVERLAELDDDAQYDFAGMGTWLQSRIDVGGPIGLPVGDAKYLLRVLDAAQQVVGEAENDE